MNTRNPTYGIWENLYGDFTQGGNLSESPILSKGEGVWCPECKKYGVWNWLDFKEKTKTKEIYEKCVVCEKRENGGKSK